MTQPWLNMPWPRGFAPEDPRPHYLMGKACLHHGQSAEAVKHFRDALQRDARDFETLTWLARVLAAGQNSTIRNASEAVSLAEQANNLTSGEQPFVLDTLAMAYAEAGRFRDANATAQKAIQAVPPRPAQRKRCRTWRNVCSFTRPASLTAKIFPRRPSKVPKSQLCQAPRVPVGNWRLSFWNLMLEFSLLSHW